MSETAGDDTFEQEDHGIVGFGRIVANLDTDTIDRNQNIARFSCLRYSIISSIGWNIQEKNILQKPSFTQVRGEVFVSGRRWGVGIPNNWHIKFLKWTLIVT